jgi:uncharacterized damage-inducible protein DinB
MRPDLSRVGEWYHGYIQKVPENEIMEAFSNQTASFRRFLESVPADKYDYRYAPDKWTIREVLQHVIDAERVFAYRALRFARFDHTPLHGFDENLFAENARAASRPWDRLVEEFKAVRRASELMFSSFDEEQLQANGTASGSPSYVLAVGYTLIGHALHHQQVTKERYLGK